MAFSDLIFVLSLWVVYSMSGLAVFRNVLTPIICKVSTYLWYLSFSVSVFSLVLISVDRFFATLFPMKVSMMTGKIRLFFIVLTWAFPMAFLSLFFSWCGAKWWSEKSRDLPLERCNYTQICEQHDSGCVDLFGASHCHRYPQFLDRQVTAYIKSCYPRKQPYQHNQTQKESADNGHAYFDDCFLFLVLYP